MSAVVQRLDHHKAAIQLQILYNAVRAGGCFTSEDARSLLMACIEDLAETLGLWSQGMPRLDPSVAERAMGRHAAAWEPTTTREDEHGEA